MKDVVIVGGGLAGLSAGWRLRDLDVALLEAEHRIGGRIRSERRGIHWMNWGGHVFSSGNSSTAKLLAETGVQSMAVPGSLAGLSMNGKLFIRGRVELYPFRVPMSNASRVQIMRAGAKVRLAVMRYSRMVELRPGETEAQRQQRVYEFMNDETFAHFIGNITDDARALFEPTVTRSTGEMHEISAGAGIGYFNLIWNLGAGLSHSILGGPSRLTHALADGLGDRVQTGARVLEVVENAVSVTVRYSKDGVEHEVQARSVVMATTADVTHRIAVNLDAEVREALSHIKYGTHVAGAFLTNETERQVWDDSYAIATPKRSMAVVLNQSSVIRGSESERQPGTSIMAFSPASLGTRLLDKSDDEIREIYMRDLDQVLPNFTNHVVEFQPQRWPVGSPYCFPGRAKLQPVLTQPRGRVFLAGDFLGTLYTETSIQTGITAAGNVRRVLEHDNPRAS